MPVDLGALAPPGRSAVLVMEMQRGVAGDLTRFPELVEVCERRGVAENAAAVLAAARAAGVPVIHCTAAFRADRAGSHTANCPFVTALLKDPAHMLEGTGAVEVLPALLGPGDLESRRYHGFSPFTGTSLDTTLRSLGVSTVVATGLSLNLGIPGLALEAVNLGYRVAVVTDAVAGVPDDYAQAVLRNTVSLLAARVTAAEVAEAWK
ncbi:isochorismatase family protein [Planomonospora venezuelensis]|uniref:Nicotinamidase-related amidase n=1 Tax=Planomonospora venezuelensis TaxID=1999 RepID=A0A841D5W6_PLAVE|nr:isochorismatase family protein [Planomonospora venezuelensis]MBB5965621.1 nicotinamidase-related amidase [Planomonospora venezuelensis]GIN04962.1 isochorismatase [Planomonospora venezuelensis]